MSAIITAKKLVETRLKTISPALPIAWESASFNPPADGSKYLRCSFQIGTPDDSCVGGSYYREKITFNVYVLNKLNIGTVSALNTAEAIRSLFPKGYSVTEGSTRVHVLSTPRIAGSVVTVDRLVVPISISLTVESL